MRTHFLAETAAAVRCPRCSSQGAESLAAALPCWFCCLACGHIWPGREAMTLHPVGASDRPR